jgi:hypothetical protein
MTPTVGTNTKLARPVQSRGTRSQVIDAIVGLETGVTLVGELIPEVMSSLVAAWFGTGSDVVTGSAGTGYTHTMTPKNALPSLSVECDYDLFTQVLARRITGCMVDQVILRATNQALATLEAQLIGQRESTPATPGTPSNPTPAITTLQPLDFSLLAATYKGSATTQLIDLTLTLMNHVQRVFSNNSQLYIVRLVPTLREIGLTTTLDFLDTNFYSDLIAGTKPASGIVLTMTTTTNIAGASNPYQVQFTLPGVRANGTYTLNDANQVLQQQIAWSITQSGANEVSASWVNSESAALA